MPCSQSPVPSPFARSLYVLCRHRWAWLLASKTSYSSDIQLDLGFCVGLRSIESVGLDHEWIVMCVVVTGDLPMDLATFYCHWCFMQGTIEKWLAGSTSWEPGVMQSMDYCKIHWVTEESVHAEAAKSVIDSGQCQPARSSECFPAMLSPDSCMHQKDCQSADLTEVLQHHHLLRGYHLLSLLCHLQVVCHHL